MTLIPWSAYVLTAFGILYGWILSRAALDGVYRITGIRILDGYLLAWLFGLLAGVTPLFLYLAFGFQEFKEPFGLNRYTKQIHWAGRAQVIFFVLYAVFVLTTVKQRSDQSVSSDDIRLVVVLNIAFALVAIFFGALKGVLARRK